MNVIDTALPGVKIIRPVIYSDSRGFFFESFHAARYAEAGITANFVQDNHSSSSKNVLRGLHYQINHPQGKLIRVTHGRILDIVADIDQNSETYGQHIAFELDATDFNQIYIPPGYAHGFLVLSERADFLYKCTDYYHPNDEGGVMWNDEVLNIEWPVANPLISKKDSNYQKLSNRFTNDSTI